MTTVDVLLENNSQIPASEKTRAIEKYEKLPFQTEIKIGGAEVIEKISDEWTALCEEGASNTPFFRPEWFTAFVTNFEKEILLLTVRRNGNLRAVLPLIKKTGNLHGIPARKLQSVFNLQTQRFDLIHGTDETEREEIIKAIWNEIKNLMRWHVLEFRLIEKESWLKDLLIVAEKENYLTGIWEMDGAPFVILPQGDDKDKIFKEFYSSLKRRFRQDLKRRLARLKEEGEVEFVKTHGYQQKLMEKYLDLEARSWKGRAGTAAACDPIATKLQDDFARAVAEKNAFYIYELKFNGETIAMSLNIMYDWKTVFWKTSFDEKYRRFSPGNLLIKEFLADAVRNNSTELDMLSPATDYKLIWASGVREHVAFYIFQPRLYGSLLWNWKFSLIKRLRKYKNKTSQKSAK